MHIRDDDNMQNVLGLAKSYSSCNISAVALIQQEKLDAKIDFKGFLTMGQFFLSLLSGVLPINKT